MGKLFNRHLPWCIWLCILLVLSLLPGENLPKIEFNLFKLDTLVHFLFYSVLAFLMLLGFKLKKNEPFYKRVVLIVIVGVLIGICIEFIQGNYISNRYFSLSDIIANTIGSFIGTFVFVKFHLKKY